MDLARFGARNDGGVDRRALSDTEIAARAEVFGWDARSGSLRLPTPQRLRGRSRNRYDNDPRLRHRPGLGRQCPRRFRARISPGKAQRKRERQLRDEAAAIVEKVGLGDRMNAEADSLSCGELRLLELAVALGAGPQLLMLDEPAAGLNTEEAYQLGGVLRKLIGDGVEALLLIEHNMALVMEVSDRIVVLNFGRKIAEGTPEQIRGNSDVVEAYLGKPAP
jgi:ABC-type dipeptide/oligopeptide/nickel transport system ATPase component